MSARAEASLKRSAGASRAPQPVTAGDLSCELRWEDQGDVTRGSGSAGLSWWEEKSPVHGDRDCLCSVTAVLLLLTLSRGPVRVCSPGSDLPGPLSRMPLPGASPGVPSRAQRTFSACSGDDSFSAPLDEGVGMGTWTVQALPSSLSQKPLRD